MHRRYLNSISTEYDEIPGPEDDETVGLVRRLHDSPINHDYCNVNVLTCITGYVFRILIVFVVYPINILNRIDDNSYSITFWFYNALYGIIWGMQSAAFSSITEEIEPKYHESRRIEKMNLMFTSIITSFLILGVGLAWDNASPNRLWNVQGTSYIFALILLILMLYANRRKQTQSSSSTSTSTSSRVT